MSYLDNYKNRLNSYGIDSVDAKLNTSKDIINKSFISHPSYVTLKINSNNVDAIIESGKNYNYKKVIFRPDSLFDIGDLVELSNNKYLIFDFNDNKLYPTAQMQLCNNTLSFTGQPTKTKIGTEPSGAPIYDEKPGQLYSYPCIVQTVTDIYDGSTLQINIPDTKLTLIIQNVDNDDLKVDLTFQMYGNNYKIYGFDRSKTLNDKGLLYIFADKV